MIDITMPQLSEGMLEGTVLQWLKSDGDPVEVGDELVEVETDKATMALTADAAGLLRIVAVEGTTIAVGAVMAQLAADATELAAPPPAPGGHPAPPAPAEAPPASAAEASAQEPPAAPARGRASVSPLARRLAAEHGIELSGLTGTGPGGRIVKADVERAVATAQDEVPEDTPVKASEDARGTVTITELSRLQRTVARRMTEAKTGIPEFTVTMRVAMDRALALRRELVDDGIKVSVNDLVIKAAALALVDHPRANGAYGDRGFEHYGRINVGVAVATDDGLIVPVVTDADRKSVREIAAEARRLAERTREGVITPPELAGGTFTVSNLGMFGVESFTAVINPPQAAILAVGGLVEEPVIVDERLATRQTMLLTLTCDHRILYGADAARLLAAIRDRLQSPLTLLV